MSLPEIIFAGYIGLGVVWLLWFQMQKGRVESSADVFWIISLNSPLIQVVLIPLWPILLLLTWPKKERG